MLLRHHTIQGLMAVDWIEEYPGPNQVRPISHLPHALIDTISPRAMLIGELHPWGSLQDLMATYRWYSCRTYPKQNSADEASPLPDAVTRVFTLQRTTGERLLPPALTTTDELMLKILLRMALSITQGVCFLHSGNSACCICLHVFVSHLSDDIRTSRTVSSSPSCSFFPTPFGHF